MQIEPPDALDWILLTLVGALAGMVNALRAYSTRGTGQALIVGAVEGATALFVTIVTFLILHSFLPEIIGQQVQPLGLIGLSGAIAHLGLRQTIRMVLKMADTVSKDSA